MIKLLLFALAVARAESNDLALIEALEKAGLQSAQVMGQRHLGAEGFSCANQGETYRCSGLDMGSNKKIEFTGPKAEAVFKAMQTAGAKPVDGVITAPDLVCKQLKDETGETIAQRTTCTGVDDPGPAVDPDKMCDEALKRTCESMQALKCVTEILHDSGVTKERIISPSAKESLPAFEKAGFTNVLATNPKLLDDPTMIPKGAVIIFEKASGGCPVSSLYGTVGIKCRTDDLTWAQNKKMTSRSLTQFVKQNRACVKSVLTHVRIQAKAAPAKVPAAAGAPAKK